MPDAFFASTSKKRKRPPQVSSSSKAIRTSRAKAISKKPAQQRKAPRRDEELDSNATHSDIDDIDLRASDIDPAESDREDDVHETPAEKRLRLANIYLASVKEGLTLGDGEFDAAEIDRDIISARLKEDVLENAGKLHLFVAGSLMIDDPPPPRLRIKGHRLAVTSALVSHDAKYLYMAGKEGGISAWDLSSGNRLSYSPKVRPAASSSRGGDGKGKGKAIQSETMGHTDEVLALALSGDGQYLVSAGKDRRVGVWDVSHGNYLLEGDKKSKSLVWVKGFGGHKDTISALSFRKSTNILYSASSDRTIKLFDLSFGVMGYVETLFGHQDCVTGLDSLKGDTAVSCGGRDRTCRFWKIADESQLVFRGGGVGKTKARDILEGALDADEESVVDPHRKAAKGKAKEDRWVEGSVDCVAMVDEQTFVSGGDSGSIALWSTNKKKPLFTQVAAHGLEEIESSTEGVLRRPRWIMSIACLRYSDLFASGSWDGHIRLWKLDPSLRSFSPVGVLLAPGLINSLQLMSMPKGWDKDSGWNHGHPATLPNGREQEDPTMSNGNLPQTSAKGDVPTSTPAIAKTQSHEGVLIVAAIGQEPRLGRWVRLRGEGIVNSALVFALRH